MIIAVPADEDLCVAPELAILTALEASLAIAAKVLNIAHTEILAPGDRRCDPSLDTRVAAEIIAEAAHLIATINRYRLALCASDAYPP
jgi:predicted RNA-binding Zn ribbon-like protein